MLHEYDCEWLWCQIDHILNGGFIYITCVCKKSYICKQITSTSQFPVCKNKIQGATRNPIWNFFLIVNEILKLILLKKMMISICLNQEISLTASPFDIGAREACFILFFKGGWSSSSKRYGKLKYCFLSPIFFLLKIKVPWSLHLAYLTLHLIQWHLKDATIFFLSSCIWTYISKNLHLYIYKMFSVFI